MIDHDYDAHSGEADKETWRALRGPMKEQLTMPTVYSFDNVEAAIHSATFGEPFATNSGVSRLGWESKTAAEILAEVNELLKSLPPVDEVPLPPGCRWEFDKMVVDVDSPLYPAIYRWWMDSIRAKMKWYRSKSKRHRRPQK